jgi:adenylate kinase family enzyme
MIRSFDEVIKSPEKRKEIEQFLKINYRGRILLQDVMKSWDSRSTKTLLPTELILALAKREIQKLGRKAIFIDGFPRDIDQVSYSLFFRDLINYRDDPDVFILIDVPTDVIDERVKFRVICPLCNASRNTKLLATKKVEHQDGKFYLVCDNTGCPAFAEASAGKPGVRMVTKEGDEQGIEPIRARLEKDEMLIKEAYNLEGIPKVLLRNSIPSDKTKDYADDYEITPEFVYSFENGEVKTTEKPWEVKDDEGVLSNSLMPPPVVVSLIKQLTNALGI